MVPESLFSRFSTTLESETGRQPQQTQNCKTGSLDDQASWELFRDILRTWRLHGAQASGKVLDCLSKGFWVKVSSLENSLNFLAAFPGPTVSCRAWRVYWKNRLTCYGFLFFGWFFVSGFCYGFLGISGNSLGTQNERMLRARAGLGVRSPNVRIASCECASLYLRILLARARFCIQRLGHSMRVYVSKVGSFCNPITTMTSSPNS